VSRRLLAAIVALVVLAALGIGSVVWLVVRNRPPPRPQISAYSNGHLTRVGPYRYCNVLNPNDCQESQSQGELPVTVRDPVQLSVPTAIGRAPWRLLRVYRDPADATVTLFRPGTRLAVTIPTVDPRRGRLTGVVVQLLTVARDRAGQWLVVPHAEWSVRTIW
jgi:hypothetical protein